MTNEISSFNVPYVGLEGVFPTGKGEEIFPNGDYPFQIIFESAVEEVVEAMGLSTLPDQTLLMVGSQEGEEEDEPVDSYKPDRPDDHDLIFDRIGPYMHNPYESNSQVVSFHESEALPCEPVLDVTASRELNPDLDGPSEPISHGLVSSELHPDTAQAIPQLVASSEPVPHVAKSSGSIPNKAMEVDQISGLELEGLSPVVMGPITVEQGLTERAENVDPYNQISREIQFSLEKKGPMEFRMQLEPKHLGEIDVKLKISGGSLVIDILAANPKTQELLVGQVDKLIMGMGLENVLVERVQINSLLDAPYAGDDGQGYPTNAGMDFTSGKREDQLGQQWGGPTHNTMPFNQRNGGVEAGLLDLAGYGEVNRIALTRMDYII